VLQGLRLLGLQPSIDTPAPLLFTGLSANPLVSELKKLIAPCRPDWTSCPAPPTPVQNHMVEMATA
jgi:hypothetical protein